MFRFLARWSLEITGTSIIGYHYFLTPQQRADCQGVYRSILNSTRASSVVARSIYDYYYELQAFQYNSEEYHQKRGEIHDRVAKRILSLSQSNKGIYLKLGQYIGNLQRVVPYQFTEVLKVLQDSTIPLSYEEIKVVIEEDLKVKPYQLFDVVRKQPIGAASVAQVHRAILLQNGLEVACKIQYPFLRTQSKYDMLILSKIVELCNYLLKKHNYSDFDLIKLFRTWTDTIYQQLDFRLQVQNGEKTRENFSNDLGVYVPRYYKKYCTDRIIMMQYVQGAKINDPEAMKKIGIDPQKVAKSLTQIFSAMIFKHKFVHCDAHPGNILVRRAKHRQLNQNYQIILLDHGLYRKLEQETLMNFSHLFISLVKGNKKETKHYANKLNIQKHYEYLPIIFLNRTINSSKKFGDPITPQQRKYFKDRDIANFQSINNILQDLPPDLFFIIRASNLVSMHCRTLGGTGRYRILEYTAQAIKKTTKNPIDFSISLFFIGLRMWIFEHFFRLYRLIFGTLA